MPLVSQYILGVGWLVSYRLSYRKIRTAWREMSGKNQLQLGRTLQESNRLKNRRNTRHSRRLAPPLEWAGKPRRHMNSKRSNHPSGGGASPRNADNHRKTGTHLWAWCLLSAHRTPDK